MKRMKNFNNESAITLVALIITIIILIILAAVTIKVVTDMKILDFAIKGTEDYSKAQDKEMEDFEKIENLLTDTISNIQSGNTGGASNNSLIPTEADIGKYINYVPQGTDYTVEAKYSGTGQTSGTASEYYNIDQIFTQDTSLKWKIFKLENNILYIISDKSPVTGGCNNTGTLYINSSQGYNNGVTLLDKICDSIYGIADSPNIKAQNLKLEDILEIKSDEITPSAGSQYETVPYPFASSRSYPKIWYSNEKGSLNNAKNNRSTAYDLINLEDSRISSTSENPYYTFWGNSNMNTSEAWINESYYNMIMEPAQTRTYWLSSRLVYPKSNSECYFGLHYVFKTGITYTSLFTFASGSESIEKANNSIRPLVQIPLSECEITESTTSGMDFDITIK